MTERGDARLALVGGPRLPSAWAMDGFHALISFGHGLEAVMIPSTALLGFGLVFSAVGARFLKPE